MNFFKDLPNLNWITNSAGSKHKVLRLSTVFKDEVCSLTSLVKSILRNDPRNRMLSCAFEVINMRFETLNVFEALGSITSIL